MDDRIDALLADVEAAEAAAGRHARRGELGDEVAAQASELTLRERLRGSLGHRVHVVLPGREVIGLACFLGRGIIVVDGPEFSVIATSWIRGLRSDSRAHRFEAGGLERLGLGSALRRWAAMHVEVSIDVADRPAPVRGLCALVGADYVEIAGRIIPFAAIVSAHARSNPFG
ncbi:hypothetical protein [Brevibacterium spongiae]|uniref:Uncharacterized protein n=1 Tax=Brevibacterium spongiae TaxID=2909672 RepID=A0ABY5STB3_9MICO|nr:hypothetical protein [Brevibacterium spongiae]UVI37439.1 hypothetical protein L1F31_07285 [Brevibacterium spongiae]